MMDKAKSDCRRMSNLSITGVTFSSLTIDFNYLGLTLVACTLCQSRVIMKQKKYWIMLNLQLKEGFPTVLKASVYVIALKQEKKLIIKVFNVFVLHVADFAIEWSHISCSVCRAREEFKDPKV